MTTDSWKSFTSTTKVRRSVTTILICAGAMLIISQFVFSPTSSSFINRYFQQPFLVVSHNPTTNEETAFEEAVKEIENADPKENPTLKVNQKTDSTETLIPIPPNNTTKENPNLTGECNIYKGKWIYDETGPLYTNNSCPVITKEQNCQGNGRPDKGYENWRWKPNDGCDLPRFQPKKFLELMRGKTLAFVGDSLARNQFESLLCMLWQAEVPKNKGNKKMQRWYFQSTSTYIVRIWSTFLVHKIKDPISTASKVHKVFLDVPDETFLDFVSGFDVLVLSSGHWYSSMNAYVLNGTVARRHLGWPKNADTFKFNKIDAFGISTETALTALAQNPNFTGLAIVRSYSPDHYEHGAWNTGGSCTGKTEPVKELVRSNFNNTMYSKQIQGFQEAVKKAGNSSKVKLMDITGIFKFRHDGHPGPYTNPDPNKKTKRGPNGKPPPQDCLHWCLPGPVDTWNEMLLEIIRREFRRVKDEKGYPP